MRKYIQILILIMGFLFFKQMVAQCPTGWSLTSGHTRLYLYFPTASDATFPEYDPDVQTSPLEPFNVSDLDAGIGTTEQLRNRITDIVKEDYCEFDVEILSSTTAPVTTGSQWQVVGFGSDDELYFGSDLFGVAQDVDLNNADAQDYARVYANSFNNAFGTAELNGANSTLERWATAIGHTASHEAGHNFGLSHNNSEPRTGEDEQNNHIMATGPTGLTGEMRVSRNRHFSDQSYEILGHNIGMRIKTLYNWDFINPNAEDAHSLVLTILSTAASLTLNWSYNGSTSPWTNPTIATAGTQSFQGTTYNKFALTFSTPKAWSGGSNGIVPGGVEFHVGATFAESNPVIVYETRLRNAASANLALHPRMAGFNNGAADLSTGDFNMTAFNPNPGDGALQIENLQIMYLPRMASIESMINGRLPQSVRGDSVNIRRPGNDQPRALELKENSTFKLASFRDKRFVDIFYDSTKCSRGSKNSPVDANKGEVEYCPNGWALSLFPSTYVYVIATVVDPNAKYWDKAQAKYVNGQLRTKIYQQFTGMLPDFNKNGIDDIVDIRNKTSVDNNGNGIVDSAENDKPVTPDGKGFNWWWIVILILFSLLVIYLIRRKK